MSRLSRRAAAVAAGLLVDRALGEPPANVHPVALFGRAMSALERTIWTNSRQSGIVYTASGVAVGAVAGRLIRSTTVAVAVAAAGRELRRVATTITAANAEADLEMARERLPALVGRDPSVLDASGIAAAVVESLAENSVDAVVAPAMWGLVAGAPGALTYRAINTLDAMVGHKSDRYVRFGWAAARLDDAANYVPARLFYALVQLTCWSEREQVRAAVRSTGHLHPSPNAGVAEAAVAGALSIELGGPLQYGERHENRPTLGTGSRPTVDDMNDAIALVDRAEQLLTAALVGGAIIGWLTHHR